MPGIMCELRHSKKGLIRRGGNWETDQRRRASLPDTPADFVPVRDLYGIVAMHATKLNHLQELTGRVDYLFAPEPVKEAK